jgi:DNA uptake protein ComE-like DNA-binding protein
VALALLTPSALPETAPLQDAPSPSAIEISTAVLQWINAASAEKLADELPGIGPLYAERIATHRRLFGSITEARTLIDLGIPAGVVERLPAQAPSAP